MGTYCFRSHARRVNRTALQVTLVLACGLAAMSGPDPLLADDPTVYLGRRLVDVLRELRDGKSCCPVSPRQ